MRIVLIFWVGMLGWGCKQPISNASMQHPRIVDLLAADTAFLKQNPRVFTKQFLRNGKKEQHTFLTDSIDWKKEWVFLWNADISNPALVGKYTEQRYADSIVWVAQDNKLKVKRLVTYGSFDTIKGFSAHIQNISFLHQVHYRVNYRSLTRDSSSGMFYRVEVEQHIPFIEQATYSVQGIL